MCSIMKKKKVGSKKGITLVLSGGGAKGLAHIGAIEVLEENKIPIKRIIGTSSGALVGGLYSAGRLEDLKKMILRWRRRDVFKTFFAFPSHDAIFNSKKIDKILRSCTEGVMIEDLKIPFIAVAFNLSNGKREVFTKGDLFNAIRSSISIPGFFKPFKLGESIYIDGGVIDVVPVDVAKKYKNKILAVNVETHPLFKTDKLNVIKILDNAAYIETYELARLQERDSDLVIHPKVSVGHFEFYKAKELIKEGRRATEKELPRIRKLLS